MQARPKRDLKEQLKAEAVACREPSDADRASEVQS